MCAKHRQVLTNSKKNSTDFFGSYETKFLDRNVDNRFFFRYQKISKKEGCFYEKLRYCQTKSFWRKIVIFFNGIFFGTRNTTRATDDFLLATKFLRNFSWNFFLQLNKIFYWETRQRKNLPETLETSRITKKCPPLIFRQCAAVKQTVFDISWRHFCMIYQNVDAKQIVYLMFF